MFALNRTLARNVKTHMDDMAAVKFALTALGYYDDTRTGLSPYGDEDLFHSIKAFQKDNDLKIDGVMKPDGPTQARINEKLKKDQKKGTAFGAFWKNYWDMREADTKGADKYFHCVANYEATERGREDKAEDWSDTRAWYKSNKPEKTSIYKNLDIWQDQGANIWGWEAAKTNTFKSAREACEKFRPKGLDDKY